MDLKDNEGNPAGTKVTFNIPFKNWFFSVSFYTFIPC